MQSRIPGDLAKKLANIVACTTEAELHSTISSINDHTKRAYFSFLINLHTFFNALETAELDRYLNQLQLAKKVQGSAESTLIDTLRSTIVSTKDARTKNITKFIHETTLNLHDEQSCENFYKTITLHRPIILLNETVAALQLNEKNKNHFKRTLCSYMVNNTIAIVAAQVRLTPSPLQGKITPDMKLYTNITTEDTVAKNVLLTIKDLILNTDWNVGLFGGTEAPGQPGEKIPPGKKIPHRMATILSIIAKHEAQSAIIGTDVMIWQGACTLVAKAAEDAINNTGLSFFGLGKRSKDTREHYQQFVKLIKAR